MLNILTVLEQVYMSHCDRWQKAFIELWTSEWDGFRFRFAINESYTIITNYIKPTNNQHDVFIVHLDLQQLIPSISNTCHVDTV